MTGRLGTEWTPQEAAARKSPWDNSPTEKTAFARAQSRGMKIRESMQQITNSMDFAGVNTTWYLATGASITTQDIYHAPVILNLSISFPDISINGKWKWKVEADGNRKHFFKMSLSDFI